MNWNNLWSDQLNFYMRIIHEQAEYPPKEEDDPEEAPSGHHDYSHGMVYSYDLLIPKNALVATINDDGGYVITGLDKRPSSQVALRHG